MIKGARHNFRKLNIWKEGMELVNTSYNITKSFPKTEVYSLSNQLQRAAISIPSNIAEGASKGTDKHFLQYLESALGSAFEWETQVIIAHRQNYINNEIFNNLEKRIQSLQGMIIKFVASLKS